MLSYFLLFLGSGTTTRAYKATTYAPSSAASFSARNLYSATRYVCTLIMFMLVREYFFKYYYFVLGPAATPQQQQQYALQQQQLRLQQIQMQREAAQKQHQVMVLQGQRMPYPPQVSNSIQLGQYTLLNSSDFLNFNEIKYQYTKATTCKISHGVPHSIYCMYQCVFHFFFPFSHCFLFLLLLVSFLVEFYSVGALKKKKDLVSHWFYC